MKSLHFEAVLSSFSTGSLIFQTAVCHSLVWVYHLHPCRSL